MHERTYARSVAALGCAALAAGGCGGEQAAKTTTVGANAAKFAGDKRQIAAVIDRLQTSARSGDAETICSTLFSGELSDTIARRNSASCPSVVKEKLARPDASFEVTTIQIRGNQAVAKVTDFTGKTNGVYFDQQPGGWRIDSIYAVDGGS
jgi:hypothetical protein